MAHKLSIVVLLLLAPGPALAQANANVRAGTADAAAEAGATIATAEEETSEFDKIRTPDSPAFVLLGVSPTQIQRPTTPKELAASLSSFVTAGGSITVPNNLALEVAPYWLWSHSRLTSDEYRKAGFANVFRDLTVSLATSSTPMVAGATTSDTNLGAGLRARIYDGYARHSCMQDAKGLEDAMQALATDTAIGNDAIDAALDQILLEDPTFRRSARLVLPGPDEKLDGQLADLRKANRAGYGALRAPFIAGATPKLTEKLKEIKALKLEEAAARVKTVDELYTQCAKLEAARAGLLVDVAFASAWTFVGSDAKQNQWSARSGWATVAWESPSWNVVGLARYVGRLVAAPEWDASLDLGTRAIVTRKKYAASIEAIWRHRADNPSGSGNASDDTYRLALAADLLVAEGSWITVTFGRDFSEGGTVPLFALANLKWGFGEPKVARK